MPIPARSRRTLAAPIAVVLCGLTAATALAAPSTRFVTPDGRPGGVDCTDAGTPCTLAAAYAASLPGDTLSLAAGTYDTPANRIPLPTKPQLHWVATDPATRPVLTSTYAGSTLYPGSGTTITGLTVENTARGNALALSTQSDLLLRDDVVTGRGCLFQGDGTDVVGEVTIEDSKLSSPIGFSCLDLPATSIVRRSTITQTSGVATATPRPAVTTKGVIEDSRLTGGLQLVGPAAIARRVRATGDTAIYGQGLVVDTLAISVGPGGAAIAADSPNGGQLRAVNVTAIAPGGTALLARAIVVGKEDSQQFNVLRATNAIARGELDIEARQVAVCPPTRTCDIGAVRIDHSNFVTRFPEVGGRGGVVEDLGGNQSADPRFADATGSDFPLAAGSPAIDAGIDVQGLALPTDLDGRPRRSGTAIDLGAYELTPDAPPIDGGLGGPDGGTGDSPPPADTTAPTLGALHLSRGSITARRGRRTTRLSAPTTEAGQIRIAIQQARRHRGQRARWVDRGAPQTVRAGAPGTTRFTFRGRVAGKRLAPGRYRFVVNALDAAGNRSPSRTIGFRVVPAGR